MKKREEIQTKIGLEIHVQLTRLKTKLFCSCSSDYRNSEPNVIICPICMGFPGTLPVVNKEAMKFAMLIGLALECEISKKMLFFRKNYFYPDLAKNFQITQYDKAGGIAIANNGTIILKSGGKIRIRRIQLEEDPAKISYDGTILNSRYALVDYNRSGISLVEIVTEPDIKNPSQAREFLEKLRSILEHLKIVNGNLDGSMRCDANISLKNLSRVEIKNISSFKEVERALNFEITRQTTLPSEYNKKMETRHWDEIRRVTVSLRTKEYEEEYRYFPEPDLLPITFSDKYINEVKKEIVELPDQSVLRLVTQHKINPQVANILVRNRMLMEFFDTCKDKGENYKRMANWLSTDVLSYVNRKKIKFNELKLTPETFLQVISLVDDMIINETKGKKVLYEVLKTGKIPKEIINQKKSNQITDKISINQIVDEILLKNPDTVKDAGSNDKVIHYLIGLVMKETSGQIPPTEVREAIIKKIR